MMISDERGTEYELLRGDDADGFYIELRVARTSEHVATVRLSENGRDFEVSVDERAASPEFLASFITEQKSELLTWREEWASAFRDLVPRVP
jgi:hypothetical protein